RIRTEQKPPIGGVVPTQSCFRLSRRFRSQDALPRCGQIVKIPRVHSTRPAPAARLFGREAGEVDVVLVYELGASIWVRRPCHRRNRVDYELEISLVPCQSLFGALAFIYVG